MPNPTKTAAASGSSAFRSEMASPFLSDDMLVRIASYGQEEISVAGTALWSRGEREVDLFVVLDGAVEISAQVENGSSETLTTLTPRQFSGELDLLSSRRTLVSGRTLTKSILLRIPRSKLRHLMRSEEDIANLIMQATVWRRLGIVERSAAGIVLLGRGSAAEVIQLQRFLTRNSYPHRLLEPTADQSASAKKESHPDRDLLPAVIFPNGHIMRRPTLAALADELGLTETLDSETTYDLVVVGAGPSGLAATVYGASEGLSTLVIEGVAPGGQAGTSSKIENYLGFPTGISGQELAIRAQAQAQKFGARLAIARNVTAIDQVNDLHVLTLAGGSTVQSKAVVIATGARYRNCR